MIRKADFPTELKIGESTYSVKFVKSFPDVVSGMDLNGYCCYETQTIYVARGLHPLERLSTFIHEALHAVDDEFDIGLKHAQIYKLEEGLLKLLGDNGLLP